MDARNWVSAQSHSDPWSSRDQYVPCFLWQLSCHCRSAASAWQLPRRTALQRHLGSKKYTANMATAYSNDYQYPACQLPPPLLLSIALFLFVIDIPIWVAKVPLYWKFGFLSSKQNQPALWRLVALLLNVGTRKTPHQVAFPSSLRVTHNLQRGHLRGKGTLTTERSVGHGGSCGSGGWWESWKIQERAWLVLLNGYHIL